MNVRPILLGERVELLDVVVILVGCGDGAPGLEQDAPPNKCRGRGLRTLLTAVRMENIPNM